MRTPIAWALAAFLALVAPAAAGTPPASSFSAHVSNPWFPLLPGTRYVYSGVKDGKRARDVVIVTHSTRTIAGVPCVAVDDRLTLGGHLEERAQPTGTARMPAATCGTSASRPPSSTRTAR